MLQALGGLLYLALERFNLLRQLHQLLLCHCAGFCDLVRGAVRSVHCCTDFLGSFVRGAICSSHCCTDFLCGAVQLASCHLVLLKERSHRIREAWKSSMSVVDNFLYTLRSLTSVSNVRRNQEEVRWKSRSGSRRNSFGVAFTSGGGKPG